jgi:hypothetical protein
MDIFRKTIATLTGGSGAAAVLLADESMVSCDDAIEVNMIPPMMNRTNTPIKNPI